MSAAQYVLALGGIENVRILLNANHQVPAGIGNHSGMVGRCFMEGLNVPIGRFLVTDPEFWQARRGSTLVPTEAFMRQHDIGNGALAFGPNFRLREHWQTMVVDFGFSKNSCATQAASGLL